MNQFAKIRNAPAKHRPRPKVYGQCRRCAAIEVEIYEPIGHIDLSAIGESDAYPVGYGGCEMCS